MKRFFLALCLTIPFAASAQLDVKAYKLSETVDKVTLRMEVTNNGKYDITIRNFPTKAREWHGTFIYTATEDEVKQLKSGRDITSTFPYVFCPSKYEDKHNPEKSSFILVKIGGTETVDYVTSKKRYNDRTIHIFGEIVYRYANDTQESGRTPIDMIVKF